MFGWVTSKLLGYLSGGLAVALLLLGIHDWRIDTLRARYKAQVVEWQGKYATLKADIIDRTKEAQAAQIAVNKAHKQELDHAAQISDATIGSLRADLRAARLRAATSGSPGGHANPAGESYAPGLSSEVPTPSPDLSGQVLVDGDTLDALAAYAIEAHRWSERLAASGVGEYAPR